MSTQAPALARWGVVAEVWDNLPVLLVGAVLPVLAWGVVRSVTAGVVGPLAVLGVGLLVVPALAPLLTGCLVLRSGDHFGVTHLVRSVPSTAWTALRLSAGPTVVAALTLASLSIWAGTRQPWMLVSVGLGGALTVVLGFVGVVALPVALQRGEPFVRTWLLAFFLAARCPVPVLAVLCAVGLSVWGVERLGDALSLLVPGPLALVWAAAAAAVVRRSLLRP